LEANIFLTSASKTEFPTNAELPISKEREHWRGVVIQGHHDSRAAVNINAAKGGITQ